ITPAPSATPSKKRNTRHSGLASNLTGLSVAILTEESMSVAHSAIITPASPPRRPISALSLSSNRIRRKRLAPSALRIAISFSRVAARERIRLETLAQAISRISPTIVIRIAAILGTKVGALIEGLARSEEHTSELQSRENLVCRLLLEKKKK